MSSASVRRVFDGPLTLETRRAFEAGHAVASSLRVGDAVHGAAPEAAAYGFTAPDAARAFVAGYARGLPCCLVDPDTGHIERILGARPHAQPADV